MVAKLLKQNWIWFTLAMLLCMGNVATLSAQTEPVEGIRENTPRVHALLNARIVIAPGQVIEKGNIIVRDGIIVAVGADAPIPPDARIWDYAGKTVYPGFIDSFTHLGLPADAGKPGTSGGGRGAKAQEKQKTAGYWNPRVHPEENVLAEFQANAEEFQKYRSVGLTAALVVPRKGIFKGISALVNLGDGEVRDLILQEQLVQHLAFERGGFRDRNYPGSLMGAIALIRQTLYDARWYQAAWNAYNQRPLGQEAPETNLSLQALQAVVQNKMPLMFEVSSDLDFLRALNIAREFGLRPWIRGSGFEYRQLLQVKAAGVWVVVPLNFPEKLAVDTPEEALQVSLQELSHWELAPANPARLAEAGVNFVLTTDGLKEPGKLFEQLRKAIDNGLSKQVALAALTTRPARMLGVENRLGSISPGKIANLVVTDGEVFSKETKILDTWVEGNRYEVTPQPLADPRGNWELSLMAEPDSVRKLSLKIQGEPEKLSAELSIKQQKIKASSVKLELKRLSITFPADSLGFPGFIQLTGAVEAASIKGKGLLPEGRSFSWEARFSSALKEAPPEKKTKPQRGAGELTFPQGAFGLPAQPEQPEYVLLKNATLWTSAAAGILKNSDMLIQRGKIKQIGTNLKAPTGARIIDATGKHVTAGIIDAHSHTAIEGGVNEGTQAVTAEVRIGDVINSNDINIYRELAGGVTTINQLHGSANPIGGQNSVIKLRWGSAPEALKFEDAPPGIKFALGENVKQSNWGDNFVTRYPQTRMGVEQIIRDRFKAALDYRKRWQDFQKLSRKEQARTIPPRKDLELETLLEILDGKRWVHSHSYRQDEILMLIRIAEDFGFQIGAFQHVLEGYKVAEAIAAHGAGASTFSDWWAYKFEVYDAIPFNGALMDRVGVVVSYNSDSNELARRLNTEAAKAVKYGGLTPEEAWKFVTINPARQLKVDHRVGSLEVGKDADFVIWSGDPLSYYTVCEQTWIDGRKYFDLQEDQEMRKQVEKERARLIQKYLKTAKAKGANDKMRRRGPR